MLNCENSVLFDTIQRARNLRELMFLNHSIIFCKLHKYIDVYSVNIFKALNSLDFQSYQNV